MPDAEETSKGKRSKFAAVPAGKSEGSPASEKLSGRPKLLGRGKKAAGRKAKPECAKNAAETIEHRAMQIVHFHY